MARILVIDDDPSILRVASRILKLDGHEVVTADNGRDAFKECREAPFDLVLTDVYMPGMDGMEMVAQFSQEFPEMKIAVMSGEGYGEPDGVLGRAEKLGAAVSIAKPFTLEEMTAGVRRALE